MSETQTGVKNTTKEPSTEIIKINRALITVSDKDGIGDFAKKLYGLGVQIVSTGGTAKKIGEAGVNVIAIEQITKNPECFDGRVKTLSFGTSAGILFDRKDHKEEALELDVKNIDLVVCNFYDTMKVAEANDFDVDAIINAIDIGGPTATMSAVKNGAWVVPVVDPADYPKVAAEIDQFGGVREATAEEFRLKAVNYIADYRASCAVAIDATQGVKSIRLHGTNGQALKYGENPHQKDAMIFQDPNSTEPLSVFNLRTPDGEKVDFKSLSSTALLDIDNAQKVIATIAAGMEKNDLAEDFPCIAVGIKHGDPCGASVAGTPEAAIIKMLESDPVSIFGGTVATNFTLDSNLVQLIRKHGQGDGFLMLTHILAPEITWTPKVTSCQFFQQKALAESGLNILPKEITMKQVTGGVFFEEKSSFVINLEDIQGVLLEDYDCADLTLAWAVGSMSRSNTITICKLGMLLGNGAGNQSRVDAAKEAVNKATDKGHKDKLKGATAYSDSFFPAIDGPEVLLKAGIQMIFASTGSKKDADVKQAIEDYGGIFLSLRDKFCRGFSKHTSS